MFGQHFGETKQNLKEVMDLNPNTYNEVSSEFKLNGVELSV